MQRPKSQQIFLYAAIVACVASVGFVLLSGRHGQAEAPQTENRRASGKKLTLETIPFDGRRAFGYLRQICDMGPRISGSEGMEKQQLALAKHFKSLGGEVEFQRFRIRDPRNGDEVPMANLIVHWHPDTKKRILFCAHYDTRPFPDRDPDPSKRKGVFLGANDGASGVALLAELGRSMSELESPYGVDFVLFDGEEYVFSEKDEYFLGSTWFARKYAETPPEYKYRWGILVDMIGDAELQIYQERNSATWRDTRPLVGAIWRTARRLGVREFVPRIQYEIKDDHLPLHNVGGIPCIDIIDFDYPRPNSRQSYWHTTGDTPDKCSPLSLAKVGWVLHEWLKQVK